jgi:mono/diheme cytochrome c family protein
MGNGQGWQGSARVLLMAGLAMALLRADSPGRQEHAGGAAEVMAELMAEGQVIFGSTCVACHDAEGGAT